MIVRAERIPESPGAGPLGRHIEHDPRSRQFPALVGPRGVLKPVMHARHGGVFEQTIGSCTGEAVTGAAMTEPVYRPRHFYRQPRALRVYKLATRLDEFAGEYPPDDTGSSGLAACKAAQQLGMIGEYRWAFGIDHALAALQEQSVITGTYWLTGMDTPDEYGLVEDTGGIRGGHEYLVRGYLPVGLSGEPEVLCDNSWGERWGKNGGFRMKVAAWARLLARDGDVTVPLRRP